MSAFPWLPSTQSVLNMGCLSSISVCKSASNMKSKGDDQNVVAPIFKTFIIVKSLA